MPSIFGTFNNAVRSSALSWEGLSGMIAGCQENLSNSRIQTPFTAYSTTEVAPIRNRLYRRLAIGEASATSDALCKVTQSDGRSIANGAQRTSQLNWAQVFDTAADSDSSRVTSMDVDRNLQAHGKHHA